jgi:hypothetical protein
MQQSRHPFEEKKSHLTYSLLHSRQLLGSAKHDHLHLRAVSQSSIFHPCTTSSRSCSLAPNLACFSYSTTMLTHLFPRTPLRSPHLRDQLVRLFWQQSSNSLPLRTPQGPIGTPFFFLEQLYLLLGGLHNFSSTLLQAGSAVH